MVGAPWPWYDSVVARTSGRFRVCHQRWIITSAVCLSGQRSRSIMQARFILANSKSAEKRIRVSERRRLRNRPFRSAARTYVKKAELAIASGDQAVAEEAVLRPPARWTALRPRV